MVNRTREVNITGLCATVQGKGDSAEDNNYLNKLNETLVNELQKGGEMFLSNAVIEEKYCLRACIVNFRTAEKDIKEMIDIIVRVGRKIHSYLLDNNA